MWYELAEIGKEGVGKFMEYGEALTFLQAIAAVLDPRGAVSAKEDAALRAYVVADFFAADTEEAGQGFGAEGRTFPPTGFGDGDSFPGKSTNQVPGICLARVGIQQGAN